MATFENLVKKFEWATGQTAENSLSIHPQISDKSIFVAPNKFLCWCTTIKRSLLEAIDNIDLCHIQANNEAK